MKTVQDYYSILKGIETRLGITGSSTEILAQVLSQALYFSEVENMAYSQESSLERASNDNSKIQLCVDRMYSVFRGSCPRVILKFKANKLFTWSKWDVVASFNSFGLFYESYWDEQKEEFIDSEVTIVPDEEKTYIIKCILSSSYSQASVSLNVLNTTFAEFPWENLSNDLLAYVDGEERKVTRSFATHAAAPQKYLFDLTIPGYGLRLYGPDIYQPNSRVALAVHKMCFLSDFTDSELVSIRLKGADLVEFDDKKDSTLIGSLYFEKSAKGIIFLDAVSHDQLSTIHYKANRERFSSGVYRSNSDLAYLLSEAYPSQVKAATYKFTGLHSTVEEDTKITYSFIPTPQYLTATGELGGTQKPDSDKALEIMAAKDVSVESLPQPKILDGISYGLSINLSSAPVYAEADSLDPLVSSIIRIKGSGEWRILYSGTLHVTPSLFSEPTTYESDNITAISFKTTGEFLYLWGSSARVYDISLESIETVVKYKNIDQSEVVNSLSLFYIPQSQGLFLSASQVNDFIEQYRGYYITNNINVFKGTKVLASVNIKAEIFSNLVSIESEVTDLIDKGYSDKFAINMPSELSYMEALLLKISNVKKVSDIQITFQSEAGESLDWETDILPNLETTYFDVTHLLNTIAS